jgi:hypothetical protein
MMMESLVTSPIALAIVAIIVAIPAARAETMLGCFVRIYDRTHLAEHPDQIVRVVKLSITKAAGHHYDYNFSLQMQLRGRNKILETAGGCHSERAGIKCSVECDGGSVYVVPHAGHAMMFLDRIRMAECGKSFIEGGEDVTGGKDDREFRLDRTDDLVCNREGNPLTRW